eukprot:c6315_g1_i1.p1 GENE.c6315_g1_i1~~c6315_g1_i1.p1  ORF type:complete len:470 (+),score=71.00 c6315_g1_i1:137-1546(+)
MISSSMWKQAASTPKQSPVWFFPGGPMLTTSDAEQNYVCGVKQRLLELSGNGTPPGLPPLTLLDSMPVTSPTPSNNRIFHIFFMKHDDQGGIWASWNPCPAPEKVPLFPFNHNTSLTLAGAEFDVSNAHCWARWSSLEAECKSNPVKPELEFHFHLAGWVTRNRDRVLKNLDRVIVPVPTQSTKPCKYFLEGKCTKGAQCPFSHDDSQSISFGTANTSNPSNSSNPTVTPILCRNFAMGSCTFGNKCRYSHDTEAKQTVATLAAPLVQSTPTPMSSLTPLVVSAPTFASAPVSVPVSAPVSAPVPAPVLASVPVLAFAPVLASAPAPALAPIAAGAHQLYAVPQPLLPLSAIDLQAQSIASDFVTYFYKNIGTNFDSVQTLYTAQSTWNMNHQRLFGVENIVQWSRNNQNWLKLLGSSKIVSVDAQLSSNQSIVVQVCGKSAVLSFAHRFLLAQSNGLWLIQNEVFQQL